MTECRSCKFSALCLSMEVSRVVGFLIMAKCFDAPPCGAWRFYMSEKDSCYYIVDGERHYFWKVMKTS